MKKLLLVLAMVGGAGLSHSASLEDVWSNNYLYESGRDFWRAPGNSVTDQAVSRGALVVQTSGGMNVTDAANVRMRDGRAVALAAKRFVSVAELLKGVASVAGGPAGIAAAIALPFFVEWVAGDNAEHIRIANGELQKKNPDLCYSNCNVWNITLYQPSGPYYTQASACAVTLTSGSARFTNGVPGATLSTCLYSYYSGTTLVKANDSRSFMNVAARNPDIPDWLPASMDDIAPYMTPRVPAVSAIAALTALGIELASSPVSVTGPSPALSPLSPHVQTTQYPAPAPTSSTSTVPGNPFGLVPNTPTVTSSSTDIRPISPGSTVSTGPTPTPAPASPGPINSPTSTTTTSTHNPTTDQTTSTTTTTVAPQTQTTTTTTVTNVTNTTNTSNVTNNTTTTTNTTNNTTNVTTTETNVKNEVAPDAAPDDGVPEPTDCEKNPTAIGCAEFGTPENPTLPKSAIPVLVTPKVFAGSGSCPAPLSFSVLGQSYQVAYTPLCDQLVYLKALMLALAGIMAAYILADSFKV